MYSDLSDEYMEVVDNPEYTQVALSGVVGDNEFDESNILKGSLYVSNQVTKGDSFTLGSVSIGELKCTFIDFDIRRRQEITLYEWLRLEEDTWESVPMGVFTVSTAKKTAYGIDVVAYDHMAKFDKNIGLTTTSGTMYQFARLACRACGVELGMTQAEMRALPNGERLFVLNPENDIVTWRDLLFWVAQTVCGIATMDREGKLIFRTFHIEADDTITSRMRMQGAEFSNFLAYYNGVQVVTLDANVISVINTIPSQDQPADNVYDLGVNPFMQGLSEENTTEILQNILDNLNAFWFHDFEVKLRLGAFYDIFDVIEFNGGILDDGDDRTGIVMYYSWHYGESITIKGVGADQNLKVNQQRSQMSRQSSTGGKGQSIEYYSYMNAAGITVGDGETKRILDIRFSSAKATIVIFQAEVLLTSTASTSGGDTIGKVAYTIDESEEQYYYPTETWKDGKHILNLMYVVTFTEAALHHFVATLTATDGSLSIGVGHVRAVIYGQGLSAQESWDGNLHIEDAMSVIPISGGMTVKPYGDEIDIDIINGLEISEEQAIVPIEVTSSEIAEMSDAVYINKTSLYYEGMLWTDVLTDTWGAIYDEHLW